MLFDTPWPTFETELGQEPYRDNIVQRYPKPETFFLYMPSWRLILRLASSPSSHSAVVQWARWRSAFAWSLGEAHDRVGGGGQNSSETAGVSPLNSFTTLKTLLQLLENSIKTFQNTLKLRDSKRNMCRKLPGGLFVRCERTRNREDTRWVGRDVTKLTGGAKKIASPATGWVDQWPPSTASTTENHFRKRLITQAWRICGHVPGKRYIYIYTVYLVLHGDS